MTFVEDLPVAYKKLAGNRQIPPRFWRIFKVYIFMPEVVEKPLKSQIFSRP